jgi:DNA-binding NtrC family response regulator
MSEPSVKSGDERALRPVPPAPADEADASLYDPKLIESAVILVVDDEALITTSLRNFFELEMALEHVVTFNSSVEAARWALSHRVDMVITDFLMPEMDGLALLQQVKQLHPEATRVLLTGYADKANAIRAINEVGLFQYIEKPWDTDRLATVVRSGLEHMALQRTLREMIEKLNIEHSAREHMKRALIRAFA